ncbi:MAG: DUF1934 domain-containing protein [Clostridia bacterium]|nr:DUF1934 domain-containing protein [Clostridia bacterium]
MEENYILSVCGRQYTDGSSDKVELQTSASYVMRNGSRYITYKEYDPQQPDKHYRTTVKIDPNNIVTVIKGGTENHHLILEKGKRHKCEYNTPYGSITMGIYTDSVSISLDDSGGELTVKYSIDIESELASSNELTLSIKEA